MSTIKCLYDQSRILVDMSHEGTGYMFNGAQVTHRVLASPEKTLWQTDTVEDHDYLLHSLNTARQICVKGMNFTIVALRKPVSAEELLQANIKLQYDLNTAEHEPEKIAEALRHFTDNGFDLREHRFISQDGTSDLIAPLQGYLMELKGGLPPEQKGKWAGFIQEGATNPLPFTTPAR